MMRTVAMTGALIFSVLVATRAYSRDDKYVLPIKAPLDSAEPRQKPDGSVKFFFGKESAPAIASRLGSVKPHGKARTRRSDDMFTTAFNSSAMPVRRRTRFCEAI